MYLYGASGHAKVIIEILEKQGIKIHGLMVVLFAVVHLLMGSLASILPGRVKN